MSAVKTSNVAARMFDWMVKKLKKFPGLKLASPFSFAYWYVIATTPVAANATRTNVVNDGRAAPRRRDDGDGESGSSSSSPV